LSLIKAGLVKSKNRSGLGWWFASLVFGPGCTLLVAAAPIIFVIAAFQRQHYLSTVWRLYCGLTWFWIDHGMLFTP
jgi:hypothetical protein